MEFEGAGFSVAQDPETDTLRIRVAITDLVPGDPAVYLAFSAPYAGFVSLANRIATGAHLGVGQAAVETEIVDAATGIRLVVFIDRKAGSKFNVPGGMKKWGHVEAAMRQWARIFRKRLIERGGENAAGVVSDTSERSTIKCKSSCLGVSRSICFKNRNHSTWVCRCSVRAMSLPSR